MIGVDITSISRFKSKSDSFAKKILSIDEYFLYQKTQRKDFFLAQRWAIKEAIFKANNDYHNYHLIDLQKNLKGKFVFKDFEITTSSENEYVVAFVIDKKGA